jgi:hypothetical protein
MAIAATINPCWVSHEAQVIYILVSEMWIGWQGLGYLIEF